MTESVDGTPVEVSSTLGSLRGLWHDGIARFAGIPFAEPPTGELRFRPPQPAKPWEGVRAADSFGTIAPQNPSIMDALFGGESEQWDEDCLYLNVWTPDVAPDTPLAVMVWIHGGGFEMGSGSSPLYDGTSFARDGVVIVTLNYRLGAFGFLELGDLDPEYAGSGNVGLLDQIAALEWVRDNIAAFGGDPGQVTIFGESAGAMSVSTLLAMPRAAGLFHRAIAQSGAIAASRTPDDARGDTQEFLSRSNASTVGDLLTATPQELLSAHAAMAAERVSDPEAVVARTGTAMSFLAFRPVADGVEIPLDPLAAVAEGSAAGVPLVIGTNSEEWKLFALATPTPADDAALRTRLALMVQDPDEAIAVYRSAMPEASIAELECAILTDLVFRIPAVRLAEAQAAHAQVFQYLWTWASPALGGMLGASHAIEIPFVFDLVEDHRLHVLVGAEAPVELARATHGAWSEFARTGTPAHPGLPDWPRFDADERPVVLLDTETSLASDPDGVTRRFWETPAAAPRS